MSGFKEHATVGLVSGAIVGFGVGYYSSDYILGALFGMAVFVGSLASDIDTGSIPSKWFARIGIVLAIALMYYGQHKHASIIGLAYMGFSSDKHRGFTHGWPLIIVCFVVGYFGAISKIPAYFVLFAPFGAGLLIHKLLDK